MAGCSDPGCQLTIRDSYDSVDSRGDIMRGKSVRTPILIAAGVAAAVVIALGVWYFVSARQAARLAAEGEPFSLLLVVEQAADDGGDIEMEWITVIPDERVVWLAIPSDLGAPGITGRIQPLREIYGEQGVAGLRQALGAILSLEADWHAVVSGTAIASTVDRLGGLTLDVQQRVVYIDRSEGESFQVDLRAGEQTLDGAMTMGFLRGTSPSSDDGLRQHQVLREMLQTFFWDCSVDAQKGWVSSAHEAVETDLTASAFRRLVRVLGELPEAAWVLDIVPRGEQMDGFARVSVRETQHVVAELIHGVDLLTPDEIGVAVFNGNGVRLMASRLSEYLEARGFDIRAVANAETFGYNASYVVVLTDHAKGAILRDALPRNALVVGPAEFEPHYSALRGLVPEGTDLLLVAGEGMELD